MSKYTVGKYAFQASAANGISNKLNYLTEVGHVLQFIIRPPPQVDTVIYLSYRSCFTYTSIHVRSVQLSFCFVFFKMFYTLLVLTWWLYKEVSHEPVQGKHGDLAP